MKNTGINISTLPVSYQAQIAAQLGKKPALVHRDAPSAGKVIRQKTKPRLNKLETAFGEHLQQAMGGRKQIMAQAITLELANGCKYTPDFVMRGEAAGRPETVLLAYEVKGGHVWDDAKVKVKVAARQYPWIAFFIVSRKSRNHGWDYQQVMP